MQLEVEKRGNACDEQPALLTRVSQLLERRERESYNSSFLVLILELERYNKSNGILNE